VGGELKTTWTPLADLGDHVPALVQLAGRFVGAYERTVREAKEDGVVDDVAGCDAAHLVLLKRRGGGAADGDEVMTAIRAVLLSTYDLKQAIEEDLRR